MHRSMYVTTHPLHSSPVHCKGSRKRLESDVWQRMERFCLLEVIRLQVSDNSATSHHQVPKQKCMDTLVNGIWLW